MSTSQRNPDNLVYFAYIFVCFLVNFLALLNSNGSLLCCVIESYKVRLLLMANALVLNKEINAKTLEEACETSAGS
jgi:hypothetical protein